MNNYPRDIILISSDKVTHSDSDSYTLDGLNEIIAHADNVTGFCQAHELVNRNRITSNRTKILEAAQEPRLKPFRFLINKN